MVSKMARFKGESVKNDTYYSDTKIAHIRTRNEKGETIFCIKNKTLTKGVEANTEMEWKISDPKQWNKTLGKIGIKSSVKKFKRSESYEWKGFHIELNHITRLGYYLEIETMVNKEEDVSKAKQELIDLFKRLGYSQKAFEKRYYLELLAMKNKK